MGQLTPKLTELGTNSSLQNEIKEHKGSVSTEVPPPQNENNHHHDTPVTCTQINNCQPLHETNQLVEPTESKEPKFLAPNLIAESLKVETENEQNEAQEIDIKSDIKDEINDQTISQIEDQPVSQEVSSGHTEPSKNDVNASLVSPDTFIRYVNGIYQCLICQRTMSRQGSLRLHICRLHFKHESLCQQCGRKSTKIEVKTKTIKRKPKQVKPRVTKTRKGQSRTIKNNLIDLSKLIVRNPCKNFDLQRTLSVKVKLERLNFDDMISLRHPSQFINFNVGPPKFDKQLEVKGRRVSNRLLHKKIDDIVEPFKGLNIFDPEYGDLFMGIPSHLRRPPLIFTEDEDTLPALSILSDPRTSCHLLSTDINIPFDYIFITGYLNEPSDANSIKFD